MPVANHNNGSLSRGNIMRKHAIEYICRQWGVMICVVFSNHLPLFDGVSDRYDGVRLFTGLEGENLQEFDVVSAWRDQLHGVTVVQTQAGAFCAQTQASDSTVRLDWKDCMATPLNPSDFEIIESSDGTHFTLCETTKEDMTLMQTTPTELSVGEQADALRSVTWSIAPVVVVKAGDIVNALRAAGFRIVADGHVATENMAA